MKTTTTSIRVNAKLADQVMRIIGAGSHAEGARMALRNLLDRKSGKPKQISR